MIRVGGWLAWHRTLGGVQAVRWASWHRGGRHEYSRTVPGRLYAVKDVNHEGVLIATRSGKTFADRFVTPRRTDTIRRYGLTNCDFDDTDPTGPLPFDPFDENFQTTTLWAPGVASVTTGCDAADPLDSPYRLHALPGHRLSELCRQRGRRPLVSRRTDRLIATESRNGDLSFCTPGGRLLLSGSVNPVSDLASDTTVLRRLAIVGDAVLARAVSYDPGYGDTPPSTKTLMMAGPIRPSARAQRGLVLTAASTIATGRGTCAWVTSPYGRGATHEQEVWVSDRNGARRVGSYPTRLAIEQLKIATDGHLRYAVRDTVIDTPAQVFDVGLSPADPAAVALDPRDG